MGKPVKIYELFFNDMMILHCKFKVTIFEMISKWFQDYFGAFKILSTYLQQKRLNLVFQFYLSATGVSLRLSIF